MVRTIGPVYPCRVPEHEHNTRELAQECIDSFAWLEGFDERQVKEIAFDMLYSQKFGHGTEGHNARLIIAKMAELLCEEQATINRLAEQLRGMVTP